MHNIRHWTCVGFTRQNITYISVYKEVLMYNGHMYCVGFTRLNITNISVYMKVLMYNIRHPLQD